MAKTPPFSLCNEFCVGGGGGTATDAKKVKYDNTNSGLEADNVNSAIDEIYDKMGNADTVQADYNQNDSTQPDYIKSRPFYEGSELLGREDILWNGESASGWYVEYGPLSVGDTVIVEVEKDGKTESFEDKLVLIEDSGDVRGELSGDTSYSVWGHATGVFVKISDTLCEVYTNIANEKFTVRVYKKTVIKQLDEKFIPDTIARTADVEAVLDELHNYAQALIGGDA